jgi:porin
MVGCERENTALRRPLWALALFALLISILQRTPPAAAQVTAVDRGASVAPDCGADGDRQGDSWFSDRLVGHARGLSVEPVYCGEVFSNTRGGLSTNDATQYQALLDLGIEFDLEALQTPLPGRFYMLAQNTHGRGISEDFVGDTQVVSNIDSFQNITRVSEYWWEFACLDDAVTVRLGKQDINTEFFVIDLAADFIQSTFGLSPSTAFPTYPDNSMGAVALVQLTDAWRLKAGVWDAFAPGGGWGFSGNDSILAIGELERTYALAGGTLPGVFAAGAVYESAGAIEGAPVSPVQEYYLQVEQLVYRECVCDEDQPQGLGIFAGYSPRFLGSQIIDESIGDSWVAGLIYTGLLPGRDEDVLGAGYAWTELFRGGTNDETVVELFYKAQLTPRVAVQPDLQYIVTPAGIYPDALAVGLRFQVSL